MEEIKFKAWHKKLKIMCDVAAINFYHGNVVLLAMNEKQRKMFTEMNKEVLVECYDRLSVSTEDVELMQYTGFKNDKDIRIYEGNIVKEHENIGEILYVEGTFKIKWHLNKYFWNDLLKAHHLYLEIIGNIYQNPELLKGEEKR